MSEVLLSPRAAEEIAAIRRWNEGQLQGLGDEFLEELGQFIEAVSVTPGLHAVVAHDVRRGSLLKFPFTVFYHVRGQQLVVLGVLCNKNVGQLCHTE